MVEILETYESSTERVQIHAAKGSIFVTSQALFPANDNQPLNRLIARSFRSAAVRAMTIDRSQATVVIEYDRTAADARRVLRQLSAILSAPDDAAEKSLALEYLDRVPGHIKRVERRVSGEVDMPISGQGVNGQLVVENLIVEYEPQQGGSDAAVTAQGTARQPLSIAGALPFDVTKPWIGEVVIGGVRRIVNLTAAGGCLVMSVIGVVTPGIPTVPFVLATGYFLARSSPRLHARFRRSRLFGNMVRDYEDHGGLRRSTKLKAMAFTAGLIVVTVLIAGASIPLLILVGVMGALGIYMVGRIPTLKDASRATTAAPAMA